MVGGELEALDRAKFDDLLFSGEFNKRRRMMIGPLCLKYKTLTDLQQESFVTFVEPIQHVQR